MRDRRRRFKARRRFRGGANAGAGRYAAGVPTPLIIANALGSALLLAAGAWLAASGLRWARRGTPGARWAVAAGAVLTANAAFGLSLQFEPAARAVFGLFEDGALSPWLTVLFAAGPVAAGWAALAAAWRAWGADG